ncbi:Protein of unknown function [Pyronema omphalodes CBS 100304]|uniref:Uncharacterized protein n=1 Tax=Pyronema omphalodes (strain CBS 100304) TaxID=1076935 RepID=U4LW60_PYROM|nr:Protein of unknown function [Pyronema omphalodes CBS 100304]
MIEITRIIRQLRIEMLCSLLGIDIRKCLRCYWGIGIRSVLTVLQASVCRTNRSTRALSVRPAPASASTIVAAPTLSVISGAASAEPEAI